jgi:hypothetical protein
MTTAQEGPNRPPSFESLDTNNDGEVSRDEITNDKLLRDFYLYDHDISGTLTPEEFPKERPSGMNQGMGMKGDMSQGRQGKPPSFAEFDINGDKELTKDELKGPLARDFERFDLDKSNSLTEDELPKPPEMS